MHENDLGLFAEGVVSNRSDANSLRPKSPYHSLEVVHPGDKLPVGDSMIVRAGNGDPRTHAHFSPDFFTSQECIGADRSPIGATDSGTFYRQNGIERRRIDGALYRRIRHSGVRPASGSSPTHLLDLIQASS